MFDFRLELKWVAADLEEGQAKGTLVYPDVGQDCDGVYDVECTVRAAIVSAKQKAHAIPIPLITSCCRDI